MINNTKFYSKLHNTEILKDFDKLGMDYKWDFADPKIDSLYEKTNYQNFEIILVDNNSKEEETKELKKVMLQARMDQLEHELKSLKKNNDFLYILVILVVVVCISFTSLLTVSILL